MHSLTHDSYIPTQHEDPITVSKDSKNLTEVSMQYSTSLQRLSSATRSCITRRPIQYIWKAVQVWRRSSLRQTWPLPDCMYRFIVYCDVRTCTVACIFGGLWVLSVSHIKGAYCTSGRQATQAHQFLSTLNSPLPPLRHSAWCSTNSPWHW